MLFPLSVGSLGETMRWLYGRSAARRLCNCSFYCDSLAGQVKPPWHSTLTVGPIFPACDEIARQVVGWKMRPVPRTLERK